MTVNQTAMHESVLALDPDGRPKVRCTDVLRDTLGGYAGIRAADLDLNNGRLRVVFDPRVLDEAQALQLVRKAGERAFAQVQRCALANTAACADCAAQLGEALAEHYRAVAAVQPTQAVFQEGCIEVRLPQAAVYDAALETVETTVHPSTEEEAPRRLLGLTVQRTHLEILFTLITLLATVGAGLASRWGAGPLPVVLLYAVAYLAGGYYGLLDGLTVLREGQLDVNLLMILAAVGAAIIGQPAEGATLLFLFSLSNALQSYAMGRSRKAIEALLDLRPPTARVQRNGTWVEVPVEDLKLDEIVMVRPGERFPIDGEVVSGTSEVDQAAITGESIPVPKEPGDLVFAGTVNGTGTLEVRVTRLAQDTTLAKIVQMVEEAQAAKAKTQRMLDDFEQVYAKLVLLGALVLTVVPPLFFGAAFYRAFYRAMVWLVVASPCALVISTPASILSAIASGARQGVLFKGGAHLERTALIKVVAFDKTGTLTRGEPRVTALQPAEGVDEITLLRLVAAVEARSEHPIAQAIVQAAQERGLDLPEATDFRAWVGQGVEGRVGEQWVWIGNTRLFAERGVALPAALQRRVERLEAEGQTAMLAYDATAQRWLGVVAVADALRPNAAEVVARLKALGVERVVMLTGDNERVAASIAQQVGVDAYYANLLPKDKVTVLKRLQEEYGPTAMVGDGVNDAPALAMADVGIAMGGAGTDVALETADVVLMADDLSHLPFAIGLARKARQVIWQNLAFAMAVIVLLVVMAFGADLPLPLGVVGHEGSTVIVVLNGLRLLRYRGA